MRLTAPVAYFKHVSEGPRLNARQALAVLDDPELGTLRTPDVRPRLSQTPGTIRHAGLPMGVHNEEVYGGLLGLTEEELKALKAGEVS